MLLAAACSTLPEASYPPFAEHLVAADFVVPASGLLRVPATTRDLVVQELAAQPQPQREQFGGDGERWLCYPAGTAVHVQCRYRSYAPPGGQPLAPAQVLAGARHLELLASP
jgi:hypothetical protein